MRSARRAPTAIAAAALLAGVAACSPSAPGEGQPTVTGDDTSERFTSGTVSAEFSTAFDEQESALRISSDVRNDGDEPVVVLNLLPTSARAALTPDDVSADTVLVGTDGGVVQVSQRYFQPSGQGDAPGTPLVAGTQVAPGESLHHEVTVSSPVTAWAPPYPSSEWSRDGLGDARQWQFCLGVVHGAPSDDPEFVTVPVGHHDQEVLCGQPEDIPDGLEFVEP